MLLVFGEMKETSLTALSSMLKGLKCPIPKGLKNNLYISPDYHWVEGEKPHIHNVASDCSSLYCGPRSQKKANNNKKV